MVDEIVVHRDRDNVLAVALGIDVSADTITSQIREKPDTDSDLIAAWDVAELTDGTDGELILTITKAVASAITQRTGYMDLKRVSAGKELPVFDRPLEVIFRGTVTA